MAKESVLKQALETVDHLAIAVEDLEAAVALYRDRLGFEEKERRVTTGRNRHRGAEAGLLSPGADLRHDVRAD